MRADQHTDYHRSATSKLSRISPPKAGRLQARRIGRTSSSREWAEAPDRPAGDQRRLHPGLQGPARSFGSKWAKKTREREFTEARPAKLEEILLADFKKKQLRRGPAGGIAYVRQAEQHERRSSARRRGQCAVRRPGTIRMREQGGPSVPGRASMGWVCLGVVALLAVWLIFGLIRAFTGAAVAATAGAATAPATVAAATAGVAAAAS